MISTPEHDFDAIVIGGGPAGCAAATVLAKKGRRVAILEKQPRRRYSVGESLIPFCYDALERMGLSGALEKQRFSFPKHSVQFASQEGKVSRSFYFFQHTDHPRAKTWQVVRSEFDKLLRDNAEECGVQFFEQTRARELIFGERCEVQGVRANDPAGYELAFKAPVTIDATGRDTFSQSRLGWRVPDKKLRKMAIWTYFEGATRDEGYDEGTTTIAYLPNKGWFWNIPLPDDRVSVVVPLEMAAGASPVAGRADHRCIPWVPTSSGIVTRVCIRPFFTVTGAGGTRPGAVVAMRTGKPSLTGTTACRSMKWVLRVMASRAIQTGAG